MNNDCIYKKALEKIKNDQKYKSNCCCVIGPTGGVTPTFTIGSVITGDPGTEADASITGISPNFILNLVIPQGPTVPTGPTGPAA